MKKILAMQKPVAQVELTNEMITQECFAFFNSVGFLRPHQRSHKKKGTMPCTVVEETPESSNPSMTLGRQSFNQFQQIIATLM